MKFQKFVKALGSDGIVYNRKNGERWLASERVFMKIPEDIRSVTCADIADMPDFVENIINYDSFTNPCDLAKAVMPYADGVIKDCVRIYETEDRQRRLPLTTAPTPSLSARTLSKCTLSSIPRARPARARLWLSSVPPVSSLTRK